MTAVRENGASSGVGVLATFTYDDLGRRTRLTRGNGTVTTYSYDPASRLTSLTHDLAGTAYDQTYSFTSYNPAGEIVNRTASNDAYAWNGYIAVNRPYTVNGLNQYTVSGTTSLGYDGRGNLTSSGTNSYAYSQRNQLMSTAGIRLYYDPPGRIDLLYDGSANTLFVYNGLDLVLEANFSTTLRRYVPGPNVDEPLVWYEGTGTSDRRWLHADERGSIVAVTDASGNKLAINSYDEYGIPAAGNLGRFQYTGQAWLPEIGMYYYKARMYSPTLGRFMQTDPTGIAGGINLYAYTGNNPINFKDPSGLAPICLPDPLVCGSEYGGPGGFDDDGSLIVVTGCQWGGVPPHCNSEPFDHTANIVAILQKITGIPTYNTDIGSGGGAGQSAPQNGLLERLKDYAKDAICALPSVGAGGGIDAYAGVGGTVQGGYSIDLKSGQFSVFFSTGVGVGIGGGGFYQGVVNAPSGISGSVTANVSGTAGIGASGSYTLLGSGAGSFSGAAVRAGPDFSANANIAAGGSIGTPKLYDLRCGS